MLIVFAGASGFLGTMLRTHLAEQGHQARQLVRREPESGDQARWDPYSGRLDPALVADADVVVNFAGAPLLHWPWTASYRKQILDSRTATSRTLAETIASLDGRPALVNGSAIGVYGDRGDEELDEDSPPGRGFLADVVVQWEAATAPASDAGARVVKVRTAVVLDRAGGALKLMRLPFLAGVGGRIGSGRQWFPSVSRADWLAAVTRLVTDDSLSGPFNVVAPVPATNADLTKELGRQLHRPTVVPVPEFVVRTVGGEASGEVLGSIRAHPARLVEAGFEFAHPTIADQLAAGLNA